MLGRGNAVRAALHIGSAAARFPNQQNTRAHIPRLESEFPEEIETACSYVGQIDGSGAGSPHTMRSHGELVVEMDVDVVVAFAAGEARRRETVGEPPGL